jgi:HSP20 family protein
MAKRAKVRSKSATEQKGAAPARAQGPQRRKAAGGTALVTGAGATPAVTSSSPFAFMRRFAEEMDRLFADFGVGASSLLPRLELPFERAGAAPAAWSPTVEVAERGGKLVVRADLPGLSKNDVQVEVTEDEIRIRGERRHEREEKRKGFYRSERSYGSFYRAIPLPEGVDPEQAKASFRNGVLEVTLPAPPAPAKGRRIAIEEGPA